MGEIENHALTVQPRPQEPKPFSATITLKNNPFKFPSSPDYPSYCPKEPHFGYGDGMDAGHAFHLGAFTGTEEFCFDIRPTQPPEKILGWGHHIWKAANGDELHLEYTFYLGPFPPSSPPQRLHRWHVCDHGRNRAILESHGGRNGHRVSETGRNL